MKGKMLALMGLMAMMSSSNSTSRSHRTDKDDEISASGQRVVHQTLNKKNIERKQRHQSMVSELASKGIIWYNNKLYWATRKLAEAN
jgi:predicted transcriptional regulator YheO